MLHDSERQEIRQRLCDQLDKARVAHLAANKRFGLVIKESPAGLPHPDGVLSIQQAGRDSREALQYYMLALKRFSDFTLYGTIPEDLLPPD
jgi:hypothetical protein